jgi:hypothetical protein
MWQSSSGILRPKMMRASIMVHQKVVSNQDMSAVTKQINVTNLTPSQNHEVFTEHLTKAGFSGFTKRKVDGQTYYTFTYYPCVF